MIGVNFLRMKSSIRESVFQQIRPNHTKYLNNSKQECNGWLDGCYKTKNLSITALSSYSALKNDKSIFTYIRQFFCLSNSSGVFMEGGGCRAELSVNISGVTTLPTSLPSSSHLRLDVKRAFFPPSNVFCLLDMQLMRCQRVLACTLVTAACVAPVSKFNSSLPILAGVSLLDLQHVQPTGLLMQTFCNDHHLCTTCSNPNIPLDLCVCARMRACGVYLFVGVYSGMQCELFSFGLKAIQEGILPLLQPTHPICIKLAVLGIHQVSITPHTLDLMSM